ncbi:MAG TPA: uroporphyrinogen-III decarboxylase-like protein [Thermoproteales archaeon]|nr:uroporphyrinogen-III decarboxylase-like protein [Thermoproteales archaeon]
MSESLTPRQRWLAILRREKFDRLPMDYWATREVTEKLLKYLKCSDELELYEKLHIDKAFSVGPKYVGPPLPKNTDIYGCKYEPVKYRDGIYYECVYHPLAKYESVKEIEENYEWPTVDLFDYTVIREQIKGKEKYPIVGGGSEPFLVYKKLRGEMQAYRDLIKHPDIVEYCLDKLFDFCYENTLRIYKEGAGRILLSYVAEDMGSQNDLLYSPKHIRRYLIPRMKRMIDLAHRHGVYVFHHNDGAIRRILPDMVKAGIDILNPVQWRCKGMDREELKREFGDKIVFHGAMDNQYTLPFGSPEEIKQEVIYNIRVLGRGGGYILAPCHNIQPNTPIRNILTMYETGYKYGWREYLEY